MLRAQINEIGVRWGPKERREGLKSRYDPISFIETPEQARKLIRHLELELANARAERNRELVVELGEILSQVETLSKRFFRWEENISRSLKDHETSEIKKLPLGF
jgi:hypothetical protein